MSPYGNCHLCGHALTENEQTVYGDQCNDCVTEQNINVYDK